ncbi:MAG: hypothetical protein M1834_005563 [Cirrosporium novae-zelandiae]|nr:MAG: hypothetical protein M1834_005563 [Cirrosporium novae-zelandiae]
MDDGTFRGVKPVHVRVCGLQVRINRKPSPWTFLERFTKHNEDGVKTESSRDSESWSSRGAKTILDDVDADMPPGSLTAIIGGSGSGKTTLLNVMSKRIGTKRLRTTGVTTFNDSEDINTVRSAYVMQQDILIPSLTVRETLQYAADLRLPPPTTKAERQDIVEKVILELGLKECANTRIGNNVHKGCSGGEKRRTSIGVQLLGNASVLFCDEPTTGLDAYSAFQIIQTLKTLARHGRTVIISIHAPRSEIWNLFDRVILLSHGSVLYSGSADASLQHFRQCGHEIPPFVNPAEFLIDLSAIDNRSEELEKDSYVRVNELKNAWRYKDDKYPENPRQQPASPNEIEKASHVPASEPKDHQSESQDVNPLKEIIDSGGTQPEPSSRLNVGNKQKTSLYRQVRVLTVRDFKVTSRDRMGCLGAIFEAIGMGILTGWIFLNLDESMTGIKSREGELYTAAALQSYLILLFETYRLTIDIQSFDRERNEGVADISAFLASRRISRFLLEDLPVPLLYSLISYFMVGYRIDSSQFLVFFSVVLLNQYIAVCLAMLCVSVSREFAVASLIGNLSFTLQSMCSGFFVPASQIPVYTRWLKWTAYCFYSFGALAANEFIGPSGSGQGHFYDCPYSNDPSDPACEAYTGRYIMQSLNLPDNWVWRPMVILVAYAIAFYLGAGIVLKYWKFEIEVAQALKSNKDTSAGKEKIIARPAEAVREVEIGLDKYGLDIEKRNFLGYKTGRIPILQSITASFAPGKINVIMGPSGSGKTSLLNSMANRLHSNLFTGYSYSGNILYNGAVPSSDVIRSVSSFVTQDDDALMPLLTVRETLHFAAGLRLPSWMSKEEKSRRAEDILLKMGLKDCADNIIGSEFKKGISGGERRRVSIATQILTDPKVLLLDEPTSGLDAFTATSIIDVLSGLAAEGRTLILSIHQSRSDVFSSFSNILLLARGGFPVYSGKCTDMLSYFQSLGYQCPQTTNPSDFVLDLITVDLQHEAREAASRQKVQRLIQNWDNAQNGLMKLPSRIAQPAELGSLKKQMNPFRVTYPLVLRRSAKNICRQPEILMARIMQPIGMGAILAIFFAPLHHNYVSVQARMGLVQQFTSLYFVGMLENLAIYPMERDLFYREREDGCYSIEAFILSYTTLEVPLQIPTALAFGALAGIATDLKRTVVFWLISAFNCFCIVSCGESVGIMFCTFFSHVGFSVQIMSVLLSIATILGGILSLNIPGFLQALNYLSPVKYSIANVASYAMDGQTFTCGQAERLSNGQCPISTGQDVLDLYNLDANPWLNLVGTAIATVVYRVVAYLLLKLARTHWDLGKLRSHRCKRESMTDESRSEIDNVIGEGR